MQTYVDADVNIWSTSTKGVDFLMFADADIDANIYFQHLRMRMWMQMQMWMLNIMLISADADAVIKSTVDSLRKASGAALLSLATIKSLKQGAGKWLFMSY